MKDALESPYIFNGTIVAESPERALSILFFPMLLSAFVCSIAAGFLSDYYGGQRKRILFASGGLMSLACLLFALTRSFTFDMLLSALFGIGFGAFSAIDWALATDILPEAENFAKDMGLWSLAMVVPNVLAAPIAGNLLDYFEKVGWGDFHFGYSVIFLLGVCYFGVGSYMFRFIKNVK